MRNEHKIYIELRTDAFPSKVISSNLFTSYLRFLDFTFAFFMYSPSLSLSPSIGQYVSTLYAHHWNHPCFFFHKKYKSFSHKQKFKLINVSRTISTKITKKKQCKKNHQHQSFPRVRRCKDSIHRRNPCCCKRTHTQFHCKHAKEWSENLKLSETFYKTFASLLIWISLSLSVLPQHIHTHTRSTRQMIVNKTET